VDAVALAPLLEQLESFLLDVSVDVYCAQLVPAASGSVGEHVRHCLDHVSALLRAEAWQTLSYEHRHRGTPIETDPDAALREIARLKRDLAAWSTRSLSEPIRVASMVSDAGEVVCGWSTLGRELAFVVNHTIHHHAIIGVLLASRGHAVPHRFGYAPSTPQPQHV
jgi:uncharacterized damage-inducible protein DinB